MKSLPEEIVSSIRSNKVLLLDFDGTLVDYNKNEADTLFELFKKYTLPEEMHIKAIKSYKEINEKYWTKFENKELNINQVQIKRFEDFQDQFPNFSDSPSYLNELYLKTFVECTTIDEEIVSALQELKEMDIILIIITNGIHTTQTHRINNNKLDQIIDTYFTSESVGNAKPHPAMFQYALEYVKNTFNININPEEVWVVGDSYKADMMGAFNMDMKTCWIDLNDSDRSGQIESQIPDIRVQTFLEFYELYKAIKSGSL